MFYGTIRKNVRFYEIQKEGRLSIGTSKDAHITDNLPFKVNVADLLRNVKNRRGKPYMNQKEESMALNCSN